MDSLVSDYAKKIELEGKSSRASKADLESLETKILETSVTTYETLEPKGTTLEQFRLDVEAGVRAEIDQKNAAIEEAAEAKKVKAKAAREAKAAEAKAKAAEEAEEATNAAEAKAKAAKEKEAATKAAEAKAKAAREAEEATKAAEAKAKAARDATRRPPLSTTSRQSSPPLSPRSRQSSPPLSPTSRQSGPPLSPTSRKSSPPLSPTSRRSTSWRSSPPLSLKSRQSSPPLSPASEGINGIDELVRKLRQGLRISDTLRIHVDKDTGNQLRDTQRIVCCKKGVGNSNSVIVGDYEYMNAPIYRIRRDIEPGDSENLMIWRRENTRNPVTKDHWRVKDVSDILAIAIDVPLDYDNLPEERVRLLLSKEEKRKWLAEKKKIPKQPDVQVLIEWELGVRDHDGKEQFISWESRAGCHKIWGSKNADNRINEWAEQFEAWYRTVGGSNGIERSPMPRVKVESTEESEAAAKEAAAKEAAAKEAAAKEAAAKEAAAKEAAAKEAAEKEAAEKEAAEKDPTEKEAAEKAAAEKAAAEAMDANRKQELKKKATEQEFVYRAALDIPEERPLTREEKLELAMMILKITA